MYDEDIGGDEKMKKDSFQTTDDLTRKLWESAMEHWCMDGFKYNKIFNVELSPLTWRQKITLPFRRAWRAFKWNNREDEE
jgi:hypothetical protein